MKRIRNPTDFLHFGFIGLPFSLKVSAELCRPLFQLLFPHRLPQSFKPLSRFRAERLLHKEKSFSNALLTQYSLKSH